MIPVVIQNGSPYIWSASDWLKIREEYRIIGNLTGCLAGLPRQDTFQGLPLLLLQEELSLLIEKKIAYVVNDSVLFEPPTQNARKRFQSYKEDNKREQMECYEAQRKQQITSMIDRIVEGKRRKLLGLSTKNTKVNIIEHAKDGETVPCEIKLDREEILKKELEKSACNVSPPMLVQTLTSEQWLEESEFDKYPWSFPETKCEKLKYSIFKDLWEKGFYITEGHKFGVDYLVYPGDPVKFHAQFLVVCLDYNDCLSPVDLIAYARLGSISRKTFVIATQLSNNEDILYQSIQWTEKN